MKTSEILTQARSLIETKGHVKGVYARDVDGRQVLGHNPTAVCFCAIGAIKAITVPNLKTIPEEEHFAFSLLRQNVPEDFPPKHDVIPAYNDAPYTTKADVLAWFDRAIEKAKKGETAT